MGSDRPNFGLRTDRENEGIRHKGDHLSSPWKCVCGGKPWGSTFPRETGSRLSLGPNLLLCGPIQALLPVWASVCLSKENDEVSRAFCQQVN